MLGITRLRLKQPATKHKVVELAVCNWFSRWLISRNWGGVTAAFPFFTLVCYWLLPGESVDPLIRVHEFVHVRQGEESRWRFISWPGYTLEQLEDGLSGRGWYEDNKFEQEAYAEQAIAARDGLPDWAKP